MRQPCQSSSRALARSTACAATFERRCAFVKMRASDSPRRAGTSARVACRRDSPQGSARGRLGRSRSSSSRGAPHIFAPSRRRLTALNVATGRESWCAARSCAWCERRVTGRTLSRAGAAGRDAHSAAHAQVVAAAANPAAAPRPDVKRGPRAPCSSTAFVLAGVVSEAPTAPLRPRWTQPKTGSLHETAHTPHAPDARPHSAPSDVHGTRVAVVLMRIVNHVNAIPLTTM